MKTYKRGEIEEQFDDRAEWVRAEVAQGLYNALEASKALSLSWSAQYQFLHGMDEFHAEHRRILDNINAALAAADGEPT
ncbi:hypothetical protein [Vreelandella aquamarina]|uniref:Uncharacterized protein n=1 Tax=Vreelandella aquamarina TaxID=77097 RepID=A0A857GL66_9GAMM|nr:hypothetical protein [Halomonas meridiana]QHD50010.1 hypothetical protein CTT34_10065 [Halomonas meridiana]